MKKEEYIEKRGEEAWARHLVQSRKWRQKNAHQYGTVDVIKILDGKITVFTEKEIQEREHHGN
jgi:hypothetical protein